MRILLPPPSGRANLPILPVFMPFAGCPHRCLFCAQTSQTGQAVSTVEEALDRLDRQLHERERARKGPVEVAFYGGTFTCLPFSKQQACLRLVARWRNKNMVLAARCSTRPDAVQADSLRELGSMGMGLVELGVQTFADKALHLTGRGYSGKTAEDGCRTVLAAGLRLGIQLMPGIPGGTPESFMEDTRRALALQPVCLRMYPCLVIEGTALAEVWRRGSYHPWTEDMTVVVLGQALALAWEAGVPVIRLSLAPEPSLERAVLDGPRHPALGNKIQAEALWWRLSPWLTNGKWLLRLPRHCLGLFPGYRKRLLPRWQDAGVQRVVWHDEDIAEITTWGGE